MTKKVIVRRGLVAEGWRRPHPKASQGKKYQVTGFARANSGMAVIKFDYFKGDEHLGQTLNEPVTGSEWKEVTVDSELDQHEEATHIAVTVAVLGDGEGDFDALTLKAK